MQIDWAPLLGIVAALTIVVGNWAAITQENSKRLLAYSSISNAGYLLLGLARPGQLGGGDIKLAGLVGLVLGWVGWPALLSGAVLGFVLSAVASLVLLAARRVTMRSAISFGPFLLGGALLAILASGSQAGSHFP